MPTLVVQLGHCYRKTGATGTTGEQEYAAKVGDACKALLHGRGGWSVRLILADDPASWYAGDAFFAIHCDGSTSPSARGASIGYRTPEGQAAGQAWKRAYAARGWPGFRPDNYTPALQGYYGTGNAVSKGNRRAVILECGFRTNAEDRALLDGAGGPERVALSIGDALGIPVTPPEEDMPLSKADAQLVAYEVWEMYKPHLDPNSGQPALPMWIWAVGGNMGGWAATGAALRIEALAKAIAEDQSNDLDEATATTILETAIRTIPGPPQQVEVSPELLTNGLITAMHSLPDEAFSRFAQASADEADRRAAARANIPVPPA